MGLEHVKQEIIDQADAEAKKIIADAKAEAKKELERSHSIIDACEKEGEITLKKEIAALEQKHYASMKMQEKKILFQQKKEILAGIFTDARVSLQKISQSPRSKILRLLFDRASKQCVCARVYCAKNDVGIMKKLCKQVIPQNMISGLIVENQDKSVRIDYTFDSLLTSLEEKKLQEVAAILFAAK